MRLSSSFGELRVAARRRLPRGLFDYIDRGVGEEAGLRALRDSLDAIKIAPFALGARPDRRLDCQLFGHTSRAPIVIAPTAMAGLLRPNGEIALARAAARNGLPLCLSTQSVTAVETLRDDGSKKMVIVATDVSRVTKNDGVSFESRRVDRSLTVTHPTASRA